MLKYLEFNRIIIFVVDQISSLTEKSDNLTAELNELRVNRVDADSTHSLLQVSYCSIPLHYNRRYIRILLVD